MPTYFPRGWYCIGGVQEPLSSQTLVRRYFGDRVHLIREPAGRLEARLESDPRTLLPIRQALGLLFVWYSGRDRETGAAPAFELPWDRLTDPAWHFLASDRREVQVAFERPFCDYFDHWHTRTIHKIASGEATSWFSAHSCGVKWETQLDPSYTGMAALRHLPFKLKGRSSATLYSLGFAVDELSHAGLKLVNLQTNTPLFGQWVEMRTLVGMKAGLLPRWMSSQILRILLRTVEREVKKDIMYWERCRQQPDIVRDPESDREIAKFTRWWEALS